MTIHSTNASVMDTLKLDKELLRQAHPDWSEDQLRLVWSCRTQQIVSCLLSDSSEVPRSMQQDLVEDADSAIAHGGRWEPSDLDLVPNELDNHEDIAPVPMTRTNFSTPAFPGYPASQSTSHHPFVGSNTGSKRGYHQIEMDYSASYTYGQPPYQYADSATMSSTMPQHLDSLQVYKPAEYICNKMMGDIDLEAAPSLAVKRQRTDNVRQAFRGTDAHSQMNLSLPSSSSLSSSSSSSSFVVTPGTSMPTSMLSPHAQAPTEAMSRQSSITDASFLDSVDMLRIDSLSSVASDVPSFAAQDLDCSFLSCSTEKASENQLIGLSFSDGNSSMLVSDVDNVGTNFPLFTTAQICSVAMNDDIQLLQANTVWSDDPTAKQMQRSDSDQSTSSTSSTSSSSSSSSACSSYSVIPARQKVTERRRKHLENSKQVLAIKSSASGPRSTSTSNSLEARPIQATSSQSKHKELLAKTPYIRPRHPRLYCDECNRYPKGFKGDHELRRHVASAHAAHRKVWIITQPATRTQWWPVAPLDICKHCKARKPFNVDYNAAAHLRRCHFVPCKRGRRPHGEPRESRAGKAGGNWPPIDWLKDNGWLTEIELHDDGSGSGGSRTATIDTTAAAAPPIQLDAEQQRLTADALGFGNAFAAPTDDYGFYFLLPSPFDALAADTGEHSDDSRVQMTAAIAPSMEHTMSAPAAFSSHALAASACSGTTYGDPARNLDMLADGDAEFR